MNKLIIITGFLFLASIMSCGSNYKEVKKIYRESNSATSVFIKNIGKADTAEKTVKAIQQYNKSMSVLQTRYKVYLAENPEMSGIIDSLAEPPRELASEVEQSNLLRSELLDALKKIIRFIENPQVAAELKTMEQLMEKL